MISYVKARAHSNIALVKYWGKRDVDMNIPAVPSISLAVDKLFTETEIFLSKEGRDEFILNDSDASHSDSKRVIDYLNLWRSEELLDGHYSIRSRNSFPSGAGMASSASGFAALAMALSGYAPRELSIDEIGIMARRGSGSAARSITGGISAFPVDGDNPSAELLIPPEQVAFGMVAVLVEKARKSVGSRTGMIKSAESSPYFASWVDQCRKDYMEMLAALERDDFSQIGTIAEQNCLAMHACMLATRPRLLYWTDATLRVIREVGHLRESGLEVYFTIDAGPQIFLLGKTGDLAEIEKSVSGIDGILETIILLPAGGAKVLECR